MVTFEVIAAGTELTYQWQYSKDNGATWVDCKSAGFDAPAFTFKATASMNGRLYRCVVTNGEGSVVSSEAAITVK